MPRDSLRWCVWRWCAAEYVTVVVVVCCGVCYGRAALKAAFAACAYTPELANKKLKALRFGIGDTVECKTGQGWTKGSVVAHMYRDEVMPPGMVAPYQVQLDGGDLIYAPEDTNELIRKA